MKKEVFVRTREKRGEGNNAVSDAVRKRTYHSSHFIRP